MKFYQEKQENKKSWSIKLDNESKSLIAVDSDTEEKICTIISFYLDGQIWNQYCVKTSLEEKEYNPFEHNNKFTEYGCLLIYNSQM
jgi:hypothetical protein